MDRHGTGPSAQWTIGTDIGGTFTDLSAAELSSGRLVTAKVRTTPREPTLGIIQGIGELLRSGVGAEDVTRFCHATTLFANAIIERKGATTALLSTKGFRDVLELRRHVRVTSYELWNDPPEPLVPRTRRLPLDERVLSDGTVFRRPSVAAIEELLDRLVQDGVESLAVCLINSYANPEHEALVAEVARVRAPGLPVTVSADVLPELGEFERASAAVLNAYVRPLAERYLTDLVTRVHELLPNADFRLLLSNGGSAGLETGRRLPIRLVESGPVGGIIQVRELRLAQQADVARTDTVVAFDMGGTTAKACIMRGAGMPIASELEIARVERFEKGSGFPLRIPAVDLIEIGAGGGSIARRSDLGIIEVGPQSSGSEPGPACYAFGGTLPTVTDADLVLGYLNPRYFLGGKMALDVALAETAIAGLGADRGSLMEQAFLIHDVVNENMAGMIRTHAAERGEDVGGGGLWAFGGAAPVHAYNVCRKLGIAELVIPPNAGVLSAVGLLNAQPRFDVVRSFRVAFADLDPLALDAVLKDLESDVSRQMSGVASADEIVFEHLLDCAYIGQGYPVTIDAPSRSVADFRAEIARRFGEVYRGSYGYFYDDVPIGVLAIRTIGVAGARASVHGLGVSAPSGTGVGGRKGSRSAYSSVRGGTVEFAVYERAELAGSVIGPVLVEEPGSTTVIDVGGRVRVDELTGSLVIAVAAP